MKAKKKGHQSGSTLARHWQRVRRESCVGLEDRRERNEKFRKKIFGWKSEWSGCVNFLKKILLYALAFLQNSFLPKTKFTERVPSLRRKKIYRRNSANNLNQQTEFGDITMTVAPRFDGGFIIYEQKQIEIQECEKSKFALFCLFFGVLVSKRAQDFLLYFLSVIQDAPRGWMKTSLTEWSLLVPQTGIIYRSFLPLLWLPHCIFLWILFWTSDEWTSG